MVVVTLSIAIAAVVACFTVPVPRGFSFTIQEHQAQGTLQHPLFSSGLWNISFATGAKVSGSWSAGNGTVVYLVIETPNLNAFCCSSASSTSFSFTASAAYYVFGASSYSTPISVNVRGTYSAPIL